MITNNISLILYVTGIMTTSLLPLYFWPHFGMKKIYGLKIEGDVGELIVRHWGMAIFVSGLLLIYAGYDATVRTPILFCVALNKAAFVLLVLFNYKKYIRNFALTIAFDAACVVIFVTYLMRWA